MYLQNVQIAFVVEANTFAIAKKWINKLYRIKGRENITISLIENRIDLDSKRVISYETGMNYSIEQGIKSMEVQKQMKIWLRYLLKP